MDRVLLPDERRLDLVLGALQFLVRHQIGLQQLDLLQERLLERLGALPRKRRRVERKQVRIAREVGVVSPGSQRQLLLVDELLVQARRTTLGQDGGEQLDPGLPR